MAEQRLIEAEALYKKVLESHVTNIDGYSYINHNRVLKMIDNEPTVEAKPVVHAHWQKYDDSEFCYCSYCGKPSAEDDNVSWHGYCPICGATMDEELERLNCGAKMDEKED